MNPITISGLTNRKDFTGKEFDQDGADEDGENGMGLYYFGKRFYDPEVIRWISTDPVQQYWNLYAYSINPINSIDPDGTFDLSAIKDKKEREKLEQAIQKAYEKLYAGKQGSRSIDKLYSRVGAKTDKAKAKVDKQISDMFTPGQGPKIEKGKSQVDMQKRLQLVI